MNHMAHNGKTPVRTNDVGYPKRPKDHWAQLVDKTAGLAAKFGRDRLALTLVAVLALVAVIARGPELIVIGFATLFLLMIPILRYFQMLD
jgi:hypothetical protein